ncbi:MAG: phosphotransferase [Patescibacteria group bacterium]
MESQNILIEGRIYEPVARHRPPAPGDSRLYKGDGVFVRVGNAEKIDANLLVHRRLEKAGFPVPRILGEGAVGDEKYFIEESLGDTILRLQFAEEFANTGHILEESFSSFINIMRRYLTAQTKAVADGDAATFIEKVQVNRLCKELPEYAERIQAKASEHLKLLSRFPFVLSHGDLSPNNLFPEGIIDLEDSLSAPFGYDAVCALMTGDWYPGDVEFEFEVTPYYFTPAQKAEFLDMCDNVSTTAGFPPISSSIESFSFFRAAWLTANMGEWPKTQKYRHDRFIREYLD